MDKERIFLNSDTNNNNTNTINYKYSNPDELLIINTSFTYSETFLQAIIKGGIKPNVKKIITSDSIVVKYLDRIEIKFSILFPNCKTIQINSLENKFFMISRIIDDLKIIENIEYKLNNYVFFNDSLYNYKYFSDLFFTNELSNIKYVKIINDIDDNESNCYIEKNIIKNIINFDIINEKNNLQINSINKNNINVYNNNILYFEYIDHKRNILFSTNIININEIILF